MLLAAVSKAAAFSPFSPPWQPPGKPCLTTGLAAALALALSWSHAAPAWAAPEARVTIFLLDAQNLSNQAKAKALAKLSKALKKNPRLEVKDSDRLLVEFAGEVPTEAIDAATAAFNQGMDTLKNGQADQAIPLFVTAIEGLEEVLPFIKKELLAKAFMALGAAQAETGNNRAARATFVRLLIWRPFVNYDINTFSPIHLPVFKAASKIVKRLKRGSVELKTEPPGARAYVDGRSVGVTPTVAFGLTVGDHYVTYKHMGFVKAGQKVTVSPTRQLRYSTDLKRSEKYLLLERSLPKIRKALGQPKASPEMVSLSTFLFVDQVVFLTMSEASPGQAEVHGYLYDLRSRLRLNHSRVMVSTDKWQAMEQLATMLFLNVRYDGTLEAPPEPPPPPRQERTPFYATWWFWSAVAVGTAGVVLPIALWPEDDVWPEGRARVHFPN